MDFEGTEQTEDIRSSGEEDFNDDRKHNQLLDAISSLDGKKRSKLSQRTVLSNQVSEFNFSSSKGGDNAVQLHELVGSLKESASHGELKNQLRSVNLSRTVSTPLARHEKEKIDRATAYETTTVDISKWDPIVRRNRKADQLEFPLQKAQVKIVTTDQLVKRFQPRTPLERQVAELLQGSESVLQNKEQELTPAEQRALQAMDVEEAKQRRKELMKYRALMSYKEAKAKRQKKIKSKRFHRILKKEKLKNEKKHLDKLQQEDPEGYLDKLNQLEKDRALERVSLKHRGGSKFAKRQMIYAKYDDRARQEVQEMLQKSRALTKKLEEDSDSDDEKFFDAGVVSIDTEINVVEKTDNPWMAKPSSGKLKPVFSRPGQISKQDSQEESNEEIFQSDYSRPEKVENEEVSEDESSDSGDDNIEEGNENTKSTIGEIESKVGAGKVIEVNKGVEMMVGKSGEEVVESGEVTEDVVEEENDSCVDSEDDLVSVNEKQVKVNDLSGKGTRHITGDTSLEGNDETNGKDEIDEIFEKAQNTQKRNKSQKKKRNRNKGAGKGNDESGKFVKILKKTGKSVTREHKTSVENDSNNVPEKSDKRIDTADDTEEDDEGVEGLINESVSRKRTLEDFEELLTEDDPEIKTSSKKMKTNRQKSKKEQETDKKENNVEKEAYVDPKKLFTLENKIRQVGSGPSVVETEDDGDIDIEEQQRMTIAQAFAEDDVIEEFSKEKEELTEKGKPKDIDLTLPGWGSWGGEGIKVSKRKRKRFTIKAPPPLPRKDEHLGHVIINESGVDAVAKHMVHEIPFPYTNSEQFEKSIRAPLGKTWNPEAVVRELVKPKVVTTLGKVILPIDKSEVSKYEKNKAQRDMKHQSDTGKNSKIAEKNKKPVKRLDKQSKVHLKGHQKINKKGPAKHFKGKK